MPPRLAVLDANVLAPAALRDTLLRAAEVDFYQPVWSATVLAEVERTLREKLGQPPAAVQRLLAAMNGAFPLAMVADFAHLQDLPALGAVDAKDRHVVAAALKAEATRIITKNLRHFPAAALAAAAWPRPLVAQAPDTFLLALLEQDTPRMIALLVQQAADLRQRPTDVHGVLASLAHEAPRFVAEVRRRGGTHLDRREPGGV